MARRTLSRENKDERPRSRRRPAPAEATTGEGDLLTGEILDGEAEPEEGELDLADMVLEGAAEVPVHPEVEAGEHEEALEEFGGLDRPLERTTSLVKTDPLTAYMNEIRRYPLLSREEEHELAVQYARTHDPEIARTLITSNLRLVVKIAHEYRRAYRNLLDLVQEGNLGLLQAVQKYDPYRGVKLSSYAAWWIRAYMLKFILNNWRLVKIGTTQAQRKLFFNLSKQREKLEAAGIAPTTEILAQELAVPEREVADMQLRLQAGELSLDVPVGRDEEAGRTQLELLEASGAERPDVTTAGREFRAMLHDKFEAFARTLHGREETLFRERMLTDTPLTLQEIGERYGISRERARQLEARIYARLKTFLRRELGDEVQIAMGLEE
jgi:RNA polymerase sigma-32 factor